MYKTEQIKLNIEFKGLIAGPLEIGIGNKYKAIISLSTRFTKGELTNYVYIMNTQ